MRYYKDRDSDVKATRGYEKSVSPSEHDERAGRRYPNLVDNMWAAARARRKPAE